jgi:hypothetical protein
LLKTEGKMGQPRSVFSTQNQPRGRGRPKNIFGPLQKESNLTNDDVKKVFKNFLTTSPDKITDVIEKYPTVFTVATANVLAQEMKGELTGKLEPTGRKIPSTNKDGNPIMIDELRPERKRSYDMVKYMIDRCFGKPIQTDIVIGTSVTEKTEEIIMRIFSSAYEESDTIEPAVVEPQIEYIEDEDEQ